MVTTKFAGLYRAANYAYGSSGIAPSPAALQVGLGNGLTGATTLTVAYPYTTLPDSSQLFPLATTTPLLIGSGSNAETVTPSAVANVSSFQGYNTATITVTLSNTHGIGDPIASGTYGLQEAINAASAAGGGTVIVDARWAAIGGTSAMIATAVASLPTGVSVADNRTGGFGSVRTVYGTLTNAQVKALNSAPVSLIAAPGSGAMIDVLDCVLENINGGVAYANGGVIQLSYGTGTTTPATGTVAATFLTSPTVSQVVKLNGALASSAASAVLNTAVYIACATADFITGTGTMKYRINYVLQTGL